MRRLLGLLCLLGCTPVRPTIRSEPFDFGGVRATVRAFPGGAICDAEPRFLIDEVASVNGLLSRFVSTTPSSADAEWSDASMALVEDALERLPTLVQLHQRNLDALTRCDFAREGAWPPLIARGKALLEGTRALLAAAPEHLQAVREARALAEWRRERLVQQQSARRACPLRPGSPIIFFAWRDAGRTTWSFCDGAEVVREGDGAPRLGSPALEVNRRRPPPEAAYFKAVGRYPADAIAAPPGDERAQSAR
ncbi:MAG: hypothetical protein JNJ54_09675 [Myxococcaceae bacterium]|nr:hypothetical protein [Myxococcaceae bacterium]